MSDPRFSFRDVIDSLAPSAQRTRLPASLEYLFETKGPSFASRLFYGAGTAYLWGLIVGGTWGFVEGGFNPKATTRRLVWNCALNGSTRRGAFVANSAGCLALTYNLVHGGYLGLSGQKETVLSKMGSMTVAALVLRLPRGMASAVTTCLVASGLMGALELHKNGGSLDK